MLWQVAFVVIELYYPLYREVAKSDRVGQIDRTPDLPHIGGKPRISSWYCGFIVYIQPIYTKDNT